MSFNDIFKSSFLESVTSFSVLDTFLGLGISLVIGLYIFLIYKKTLTGVMYSNGFALTLVGLSLVTTLVIMAVTSNVVLSLGMVGALSIVRFRAAIKEPIEIVFLFWALAVGIVVGAGMIPLAIIGSVIIGVILLLLANRKVRENPYILVLNCNDETAEEAVHVLLGKSVEHYAAMQQVVDYIQDGGFDAFYTRTRSQIDALVKTDPTAFYSYDEYLTALDTLEQFVALRTESIQGQLDGTIPSTESAQRGSKALIDASHLNLSVMGTMSMGGFGGGNRNFNFGNRDNGANNNGNRNRQSAPVTTETQQPPMEQTAPLTQTQEIPGVQGGFPFGGQQPQGVDPSQLGGQMPQGFDSSQFGGQMPDGFDPSRFGGQQPPIEDEQPKGNEGQPAQGDGSQSSNNAPSNGQNNTAENGRSSRNNMSGFWNRAGNVYAVQNHNETPILYGACGVVMLAAFLFAFFYRRKPRKRG